MTQKVKTSTLNIQMRKPGDAPPQIQKNPEEQPEADGNLPLPPQVAQIKKDNENDEMALTTHKRPHMRRGSRAQRTFNMNELSDETLNDNNNTDIDDSPVNEEKTIKHQPEIAPNISDPMDSYAIEAASIVSAEESSEAASEIIKTHEHNPVAVAQYKKTENVGKSPLNHINTHGFKQKPKLQLEGEDATEWEAVDTQTPNDLYQDGYLSSAVYSTYSFFSNIFGSRSNMEKEPQLAKNKEKE